MSVLSVHYIVAYFSATYRKEKYYMTKKEQRRRELQENYQHQLESYIKDSTPVVDILIARIAYLAAYLDELQEQTTKEGVVIHYDNGGGQEGIRVHPAVQVYTQYHKDLTASLKQLQSFIPIDSEGVDDLVKFMNDHK
jgi:citrate synthase